MCILLSKSSVTTEEEEGHGWSVDECSGLKKKKNLAWILWKAEHEVKIKELAPNLEGINPRH